MGTVGMGLALYDASRVASQFSRNGAQKQQAKYLEKAYYNARSVDEVSYNSNNVRQKTFDLRTRNPLPSLWGRVKGYCEGACYSLGSDLVPVTCSALALLSKGFFAKVGAIGVGLSICYDIARNGFGLGKQHPMK